MKLILKYIVILLIANGTYMASAQKAKVNKAIKDYDNLYYVKTSEVLLKVAENGYRSQDLLEKLANSFYFNNKMKEASFWYGELFKFGEDIDSEFYFRYAMSLKGVEDYEASDLWMEKFKQKKPDDSRSKRFGLKKDYKSSIESINTDVVIIENLTINTKFSDFGSFVDDSILYFSSARKSESSKRKYSWNEQYYLDLYTVNITDSIFGKPLLLEGNVNTRFHESSAVISPDGNTLFFTRNNLIRDTKTSLDDEGVSRLQLFKAFLNEDGTWHNSTPVHFNSDDYSVAHPSISKDGRRLYFASDMDATTGSSDLFFVNINPDGTLGTPKNLGESINTEGSESFPFINAEGDLYYSSDGFPGLGGYDIYVSEDLDAQLNKNILNNFIVTNIGLPYNSSADDFAFFEYESGSLGYFSSNRQGGKGDDDIYMFSSRPCVLKVNGIITDTETGEILPESTVVLFDENAKELKRIKVANDGKYEFEIYCNRNYLLRSFKEEYSTEEQRILTDSDNLNVNINLKRDQISIDSCSDLAKILDIPLIYFDLDKYTITYSAEVELQKILVVLNEYPSMKIDIRSHTDCRASNNYNERLSNNRANATRNYLINNGIDGARLIAKGYGESQLVNDCACEPDNYSGCTEEDHQKNRRSEFIISEFNGNTCVD